MELPSERRLGGGEPPKAAPQPVIIGFEVVTTPPVSPSPPALQQAQRSLLSALLLQDSDDLGDEAGLGAEDDYYSDDYSDDEDDDDAESWPSSLRETSPSALYSRSRPIAIPTPPPRHLAPKFNAKRAPAAPQAPAQVQPAGMATGRQHAGHHAVFPTQRLQALPDQPVY